MHPNTRARKKLNMSGSLLPSLPHDLPAPSTSRSLQPRTRTTSLARSESRSAPGSRGSSRSRPSSVSRLVDLRSQGDDMQPLSPGQCEEPEAYEPGAYVHQGWEGLGAHMPEPGWEEPGSNLPEHGWNLGMGSLANDSSSFGGRYHEATRDPPCLPSHLFGGNRMQEPATPSYSSNTFGETSIQWEPMERPVLQDTNPYLTTSYTPYEHYRSSLEAPLGMGMNQRDTSNMYFSDPSSWALVPGPSQLPTPSEHWSAPPFGANEYGSVTESGSLKRKRYLDGNTTLSQEAGSSSMQSSHPTSFSNDPSTGGSSSTQLTEATNILINPSSRVVESSPERPWRMNLGQHLSDAQQRLSKDLSTSSSGTKRKRSREPPSNNISPPFVSNDFSLPLFSNHQQTLENEIVEADLLYQENPKKDRKGKGKARATPPVDPIIEILDSPPTSKSKMPPETSEIPPLKKPPGDPLSSYTCPICFSPPTNATLTPCGHICCGACLFAAVKTTMARSALIVPGARNGQGEARCPVCRATIVGWDGKGGGVIGLKARARFSL